MVAHDPSMFEIPAWLHAADEVDTTAGADLKHFKNENFIRLVTLAWELVPRTTQLCERRAESIEHRAEIWRAESGQKL